MPQLKKGVRETALLQKAFQIFDKDGSGCIDAAEMRNDSIERCFGL